MYINGLADYDRNGQEIRTGLLAGKATGDGSVNTTKSGKEVGSVSVKAYTRKDGTAAFMTVKSWDAAAIARIRSIRKGDPILAAGRLDVREYNGKTYMDLVADFFMTSNQDRLEELSKDMNAAQLPPPGFEDEDPGQLPF